MKWAIGPKIEGDVLSELLARRGLVDPTEREKFLNPNWERDTHDPFVFTKMGQAVERVFKALELGEKIVIHGDYDADGTCGSALLYSALREIIKKESEGSKGSEESKAEVVVFLPDRERDGYGVATHTVERLASEGTNLLITVDCGIANDVPLDKAHELRVDVIICDHHQLGEKLPAHAIILHPLAPGETYPNKHLCGTGVSFKLASALLREAKKRGADFPEGYEKWFLDLVAVATVTDVMPLTGENRALEYFGLKVLNKTRRPGLNKIIERGRSKLGSVDTETIGFQIGPRINAAGRMKSAAIAWECLVSATDVQADLKAAELEDLNRLRQRVSDGAFEEALAMIAPSGSPMTGGVDPKIHIVWSEVWAPGIIGLIAGKLTNQFGIPSFAFTKVGEHYVGSGRSAGGFHLVEAMRACGDIYVKYGGHPEACGLTLTPDNLIVFREKVTAHADSYFKDGAAEPQLTVEAQLPLELVNLGLIESIAMMAPFGQGNRKPIFCERNLSVVSAETMGNTGSHLRLSVATPGGVKKLVGFGFGDRLAELPAGTKIDVAFELSVNEWQGRREPQARILDLRLSAQ